MNKKIIFIAISIAVIGVGYYLLSPLWKNVTLDEPLPQANSVDDNMQKMDPETKERFIKETEAMKDQVMVKKEAMPSNSTIILKESPLIPSAHEVKGDALLVRSGSQNILRFEDLKTINGPDLRIYLSADLDAKDFVDLGAIRATEGNVNYTIPPGTDISKYKNALIWCRAFGVLFSYAQL
ncbi:MAG: DM13 domain-containing protein [bacterium]|nr:DM13 domain-containing protein [bacterium]